MPFDPSAPFELLDDPATSASSSSAPGGFDPSQPFTILPTTRAQVVGPERAGDAAGRGVKTRNAITADNELAGELVPQPVADFWQLINTPIIEGKPPEDYVKQVETSGTPMEKTFLGVRQGFDSFLSSLTSPLGIGTLGLAPILQKAPAATRALSALFGATMGKSAAVDVPTALGEELGKPHDQRDYTKIAKLITEEATTAPMAALSGSHAMAGDAPWHTQAEKAKALAQEIKRRVETTELPSSEPVPADSNRVEMSDAATAAPENIVQFDPAKPFEILSESTPETTPPEANTNENSAAPVELTEGGESNGDQERQQEEGVLDETPPAMAAEPPPAQEAASETAAPAPVPVNAPPAPLALPAETTPRVARGLKARRIFHNETEMAGPDILSWIEENMKLLSPSQAREQMSKADWRANRAEWDDAAKLSRPHHNVIYDERGFAPDRVAQAAHDAGVLDEPTAPALWDAIHTASQERSKIYENQRREEQFMAEAEKEHQAWQKATRASKPGNEVRVNASELRVGDHMEIDGEHVKVTGIDADNGDVTLQDGTKFGKQTVGDGQTLHVQKFESSADLADPDTEPSPVVYGMGAATPSEFQNSAQTPTSIKNAQVDIERAKRGLPAAIEPARRSFGTVWDEAMARVDMNPETQDALINELREKPRALTDLEDALLLQRQIALQNQYGQITREMAEHYENTQRFGPDVISQWAGGMEEMKLQAAKISDELLDLYEINKRVGTETGRGLAARKMMAFEDYTLASMELQRRAANGGKPLTAAQSEEVAKLHQRIEATQKAFDDYRAKVEADQAKQRAEAAMTEMQAKAEKAPEYDGRILKIAEGIVARMEVAGEAAAKRIREKMLRFNAGLDPTLLYDLSVWGAAKLARGGMDLARFSAEAIKEFGEKLQPHLQQIWDESNLRVDSEGFKHGKNEAEGKKLRQAIRKQDPTEQRQQIVEGLRKAKAENQTFDLQGDYIRKLAENFVRSGIADREALVDAVHNVLTQEFDPAITRRETMDAISGYGDYKPLNPDAIKVQLRDLKGQMQQVAKLEDIQARKPLPKTGVQRRETSHEEQRLIAQVNEAKRKFGVVVTDPAKQLKSALDAIKARLRNSIAQYEYQIATRQKTIKSRTASPYDAESELLKVRRDELQRQFDEIFQTPGKTDEQRIATATRAVESSIADYERRIAAKDVSERRGTKTPSTPNLEALRARRDALQQEYNTMVDVLDPTKRERVANQLFRTRAQNQIADYTERLSRGDFGPRVHKPLALDPASQTLKAEAERAKADFQRALLTDRLNKRSKFEKFQDTFVKWRRGFLLSAPLTLAKLTSAAAQRIAIMPVEEAIGGALGHLPGVRRVAAMAPREGGLNVRAEAKAITDAFTLGLNDSFDQLKKHASELDTLYGRGREGAIGEADVEPHSIIDYFGHLHGALKAPVKRAEFARSFAKRVEFNLRRGVDVSDPLVQMRLATEAYKDAQRSIFLQDNRFVNGYKQLLKAWELKDKATGKTPMAGKLGATIAKTLLPIVRVPTNLVAETFQYALGSVSGSIRLSQALRAGVDTLPPEQADLIMRDFKKGSIGAAFMLTGFLLPNLIGGYYQPGKRDPKDIKPGHIRVAGHDTPSFLLHNPLLETLQLGATIRRVADSKLRKRDLDKQGIGPGLLAGALGLTEEVPFIREMFDASKLRDPNSRQRFLGELSKSILVPQFVQSLANATDKSKAPRAPQTILQHIETGIPGLRQQVPVAKPKKK